MKLDKAETVRRPLLFCRYTTSPLDGSIRCTVCNILSHTTLTKQIKHALSIDRGMLLQLVKICEFVQVLVGMHAGIALEAAKTYFVTPYYYFFLMRNNSKGDSDSEREREREKNLITDIICA